METLVATNVGMTHGVIGIAKLMIEMLGYEGVGVPSVPGREVREVRELVFDRVLAHYTGLDAYRNAYFARLVREKFDLGIEAGGIPRFVMKRA